MDTINERVVRIALLADTHYHFDELNDAIDAINIRSQATLALIAGDLTEHGLLDEYFFLYNIMERLHIPYLTVIGNHDYLASGEIIYQQMFGNLNYSFVFNNIKFVMFDNIFWESEKTPDFNWLKNELSDKKNYDHIIVVSHIPPVDQQFTDEYRQLYHQLLVENNIHFSVHGHTHRYILENFYGDEVVYLTIPSAQKRSYCELVIDASDIHVLKFDF